MFLLLLTSTVQCSLLTTPTFQGPLLGVISETEEVGSVIMKVQAVTGDTTSQIQYELIENPQSYFRLDQATGNLTIARQLDRRSLAPPNNVLSLTVRASAGIGKTLSHDFIIKLLVFRSELQL